MFTIVIVSSVIARKVISIHPLLSYAYAPSGRGPCAVDRFFFYPMDLFPFDSFERTPARDAPLSALGNREKSNRKNKTSNAPARVTAPSDTCNLFLNIDRTLCVLARVRPSPSRARWKRTVNERIRVVSATLQVFAVDVVQILRVHVFLSLYFFFFFAYRRRNDVTPLSKRD